MRLNENLQFILHSSAESHRLKLVWIVTFNPCKASNQFFDQRSKGLFVILIEHDNFVRNNAHLLKSDSLHLSPWEAFDDPTLLFLFHQLNLKFD